MSVNGSRKLKKTFPTSFSSVWGMTDVGGRSLSRSGSPRAAVLGRVFLPTGQRKVGSQGEAA